MYDPKPVVVNNYYRDFCNVCSYMRCHFFDVMMGIIVACFAAWCVFVPVVGIGFCVKELIKHV